MLTTNANILPRFFQARLTAHVRACTMCRVRAVYCTRAQVLVAGGAVLAALLPKEAHWQLLAPKNAEWAFADFTQRLERQDPFQPRRTEAEFMQQARLGLVVACVVQAVQSMRVNTRR